MPYQWCVVPPTSASSPTVKKPRMTRNCLNLLFVFKRFSADFDFALMLETEKRNWIFSSSRHAMDDEVDVIRPERFETCEQLKSRLKSLSVDLKETCDRVTLGVDGNASINDWEMRMFSVYVEEGIDWVKNLHVRPFWSGDNSTWLKLGMLFLSLGENC